MKTQVRTVLCATDLSPIGDGAIGLALLLAAPGATLHLLYVNEPTYVVSPVDATVLHADLLDPEQADRVERKAMEHLQAAVPAEAAARNVRVERHVRHESGTAAVIAREAERLRADVVVLGTHGRTGLKKALLGSVAQDVMKHARRPVVLFHDAPAKA
jgi:nucleotide-binding universal stress UspA family protein